MAHFYNDFEKMLDMKEMRKEDFLASYSYLTEEEYDETAKRAEQKGGLKSYNVSKDIIDRIRSVDEMVFRCAVSHIMDVGIRNLTLENIESTCESIGQEDDSMQIMSNSFKCAIVKTAGHLARIDHIHLLVYIQNEVTYDVGQAELQRERLYALLLRCMNWIEQQEESAGNDANEQTHEVFSDFLGFEDDELKTLGFGYLVSGKEEEDE